MAFSARNSPTGPGPPCSCSPADARWGNRDAGVRAALPGPAAPRGLGEVRLLGQREAAGLGRTAGEAGARERARDVPAGAIGGRGQLRALRGPVGGRRVGAEDLFLGLAGEQRLELLALDRLALEQQLGDVGERLAVLGEDVLGLLVGALDDAADLVVDLARDLVGVVGLGGELAPEERLPVVVAEYARAELLAHAEAHDHLLRRRRHLLEVVRRARGDL